MIKYALVIIFNIASLMALESREEVTCNLKPWTSLYQQNINDLKMLKVTPELSIPKVTFKTEKDPHTSLIKISQNYKIGESPFIYSKKLSKDKENNHTAGVSVGTSHKTNIGTFSTEIGADIAEGKNGHVSNKFNVDFSFDW